MASGAVMLLLGVCIGRYIMLWFNVGFDLNQLSKTTNGYAQAFLTGIMTIVAGYWAFREASRSNKTRNKELQQSNLQRLYNDTQEMFDDLENMLEATGEAQNGYSRFQHPQAGTYKKVSTKDTNNLFKKCSDLWKISIKNTLFKSVHIPSTELTEYIDMYNQWGDIINDFQKAETQSSNANNTKALDTFLTALFSNQSPTERLKLSSFLVRQKRAYQEIATLNDSYGKQLSKITNSFANNAPHHTTSTDRF